MKHCLFAILFFCLLGLNTAEASSRKVTATEAALLKGLLKSKKGDLVASASYKVGLPMKNAAFLVAWKKPPNEYEHRQMGFYLLSASGSILQSLDADPEHGTAELVGISFSDLNGDGYLDMAVEFTWTHDIGPNAGRERSYVTPVVYHPKSRLYRSLEAFESWSTPQTSELKRHVREVNK